MTPIAFFPAGIAAQISKRSIVIYRNYMPVLKLCQQYQMAFLR
jgi:hypothetical protein